MEKTLYQVARPPFGSLPGLFPFWEKNDPGQRDKAAGQTAVCGKSPFWEAPANRLVEPRSPFVSPLSGCTNSAACADSPHKAIDSRPEDTIYLQGIIRFYGGKPTHAALSWLPAERQPRFARLCGPLYRAAAEGRPKGRLVRAALASGYIRLNCVGLFPVKRRRAYEPPKVDGISVLLYKSSRTRCASGSLFQSYTVLAQRAGFPLESDDGRRIVYSVTASG